MLCYSGALVDAPRMDEKALWKSRVSKAAAECLSVLREHCLLPSDTFLAKGSANLDKLKDLCNEGEEHPSILFQLYTQVLCYGHQIAFQENVCGVWETVLKRRAGQKGACITWGCEVSVCEAQTAFDLDNLESFVLLLQGQKGDWLCIQHQRSFNNSNLHLLQTKEYLKL